MGLIEIATEKVQRMRDENLTLRLIVAAAIAEGHVSLGWCAERAGINLVEMREMFAETEGE